MKRKYKQSFDVLLCGPLCDIDVSYGVYLKRFGLRVCIARMKKNGVEEKINFPENFLNDIDTNEILHLSSPCELISLARRSRIIITNTSYFGLVITWRWFFRKILQIPPVINIPTGFDFSEWLEAKSIFGWFIRYFSRTCEINQFFGAPYPHMVKNIYKYKIKNVIFNGYPYYLPEVERKSDEKSSGSLIFFHPSHLDFKATIIGENRNSSKGNDRFIKAFIRALHNGLDAVCVILYRGVDREIAKDFIEKSGFSDRFVWKPHLNREQLAEEMLKADIIIDQFDIGGLGSIAIEAMSLGKPVMIYTQSNCMKIAYSTPPPVINAHSEEDIYQQLKNYNDRNELIRLGEEARRWIYQNHYWKKCLEQFMFFYTLLTDHQVIDYGWQTNPYDKATIFQDNEAGEGSIY